MVADEVAGTQRLPGSEETLQSASEKQREESTAACDTCAATATRRQTRAKRESKERLDLSLVIMLLVSFTTEKKNPSNKQMCPKGGRKMAILVQRSHDKFGRDTVPFRSSCGACLACLPAVPCAGSEENKSEWLRCKSITRASLSELHFESKTTRAR